MKMLFHFEIKNRVTLYTFPYAYILKKIIFSDNMFEASKSRFSFKYLTLFTGIGHLTEAILVKKKCLKGTGEHKLKLSLRRKVTDFAFFLNSKAKKNWPQKKLMEKYKSVPPNNVQGTSS